jgi:hypothetical protein
LLVFGKAFEAFEAAEEPPGWARDRRLGSFEAEEFVGRDTEEAGHFDDGLAVESEFAEFVVGDHAWDGAEVGGEFGLGDASFLADASEALADGPPVVVGLARESASHLNPQDTDGVWKISEEGD